MKIVFYTLGCKVNQYETQVIKELLEQRGYETGEENDLADIYVVNTCTVTGLADRKSRQYIRRAKKINPHCVTVVMGCYAQMNPREAAEICGADIVIGTNEKGKLPEVLEDYLASCGGDHLNRERKAPVCRVRRSTDLTEYEETGLITSMESRNRAFIKIQEGCDRFCSYCVIPYARGGIRSRAPEDILAEAEQLLEKGFKELVLTGINAALYGAETQTGPGLESLIAKLSDLPGDFQIRLGSLEPTVVDVDYVERLLHYPKLCSHLHLSLQSGSNRILAAMNRHYDRNSYLKIVDLLRNHDPNFGLTTDIIVGFPGETEADFQESIDLVCKAGFVKTHVFPYSKRKGTAAAEMEGQIEPAVKKTRTGLLIREAEMVSQAFFKKNIGTCRPVLFEEYNEEKGLVHGFSDNYIKVYCKVAPERAKSLLFRFVSVYLTGLAEDGMWGDIR